MRHVWVVAAVLLAGCLAVEEGSHVDDPAEAGFGASYLSGNATWSDPGCTSCHYGLDEYWVATWNESAASLNVAQRWPQAELAVVQAGRAGDEPVLATAKGQLPFALPGDSVEAFLEVPVGTSALVVLAEAFTDANQPQCDDFVGACLTGDAVALFATSPAGQTVIAPSPERGFARLVVPDPLPGPWRFNATITAMDAPSATLNAWAEALAGPVRVGAGAMDFGGGDAPDWLRVRLYHDHADFEPRDWDSFDDAVVTMSLAPSAPPSWNQTNLDAFWGAKQDIQVLDGRHTHYYGYVDAEGHSFDPGVGGSMLHVFVPTMATVPPDATLLRFEHTWTPPLDLPELGLKVSPAHSPYFYEPEELSREPGRVVAEYRMRPGSNSHPDGWDVGEFLRDEPGQLRVAVVETRLVVTAWR